MELTLITFTCFVYNSSEDYTGCVHWSRQGMGEGEGVEIKCHLSSLLTTFWGAAMLTMWRKCWMVLFSRQE